MRWHMYGSLNKSFFVDNKDLFILYRVWCCYNAVNFHKKHGEGPMAPPQKKLEYW